MSSVARIGEIGRGIDANAERLLSGSDSSMYGMLRYFMGYADEGMRPVAHSTGKRLRPGLLLYVAGAYGARDLGMPAALSLELFHNFSLIHDDIEDHDELRRGRPTVWKLWGVNQAINAGDAQLILSLQALRQGSQIEETAYRVLEEFLLSQYLKVIEGQHLDFALTDAALSDPRVTEEAYTEMITNKTAELIGASAKAGGLVANASSSDLEALYVFGLNLGIAYQLRDDWQSIWGESADTGKTTAGDIEERKKTLPIIYARDTLSSENRAELIALYSSDTIHSAAILKLLEISGAKGYVSSKIANHRSRAIDVLTGLSLPQEQKEELGSLVHELVP